MFIISCYFEICIVSFCGDIEERLKFLEEKKDKDKGVENVDKFLKKEKLEKVEKDEKSKNEEKGEKSKNKEIGGVFSLDEVSRFEFEEWLEFKRFKEEWM